MESLEARFPKGVDYAIVYDTTPFITESINEVFKSLRDAIVLVAIVVLVFLQNWRSAIIPLVAVPVAIIGTFAVMAAMGFSLNNFTLFGLVLAIGIVVDDAIVVVEAVEYHIEHGLSPRDATIRAMSQVSGPVIAVGLVLSAVFVPCAFITGIMGQFFRQFALTIAVSMLISTFNSLTLSPALTALLLRPREKGSAPPLPWPAFVVAGGWLGWEFLRPGWSAGNYLHGWASAEACAVDCRRRWRVAGGVLALAAQFHPAHAVSAFNVAFDLTGQCLYVDRRPAAARQPAGAGRLWRAAVPDLHQLHGRPQGLHSHAGQGLPAGQPAIARLLVSGPHRRSDAADRRDRAGKRRA